MIFKYTSNGHFYVTLTFQVFTLFLFLTRNSTRLLYNTYDIREWLFWNIFKYTTVDFLYDRNEEDSNLSLSDDLVKEQNRNFKDFSRRRESESHSWIQQNRTQRVVDIYDNLETRSHDNQWDLESNQNWNDIESLKALLSAFSLVLYWPLKDHENDFHCKTRPTFEGLVNIAK